MKTLRFISTCLGVLLLVGTLGPVSGQQGNGCNCRRQPRNPVCATDGKTKRNNCAVQCGNTGLEIACYGPCPCTSIGNRPIVTTGYETGGNNNNPCRCCRSDGTKRTNRRCRNSNVNCNNCREVIIDDSVYIQQPSPILFAPAPSPGISPACTCSTLYDPVCAYNGKVYSNSCQAGCSGASVECKSSTCPCRGGAPTQFNDCDCCQNTFSKPEPCNTKFVNCNLCPGGGSGNGGINQFDDCDCCQGTYPEPQQCRTKDVNCCNCPGYFCQSGLGK